LNRSDFGKKFSPPLPEDLDPVVVPVGGSQEVKSVGGTKWTKVHVGTPMNLQYM